MYYWKSPNESLVLLIWVIRLNGEPAIDIRTRSHTGPLGEDASLDCSVSLYVVQQLFPAAPIARVSALSHLAGDSPTPASLPTYISHPGCI